ncbi:phosphotransferase [Geobacter sp. DSM 9736]|uniref:phosphotransferase n=1 Tax=Geobacter sp. DSM 9736 TaxID=1277350 RepID=UPI000B510AD3|nr:phosphotransferase [Geobacter sp. DSM 9736]SNB44922.1 hypothetical protein SAMN06269301_0312 [Geobacter sp. DSM 9736]
MLMEMHAHTSEHSPCSAVSAVELVSQVFFKGLQGIVLTDHHHLWLPEDIQALRHAARVPNHFLILSGQEVSTSDYGDVLVYGATRTLLRHTPVSEIRREFPEAALVWAHPYRDGRIPSDEKLRNADIHAVEIFNSNHTVRGNSRGLQDWHRLRFTAIAGTDTHGKSYAGTYPTIFDHPVTTIDELAGEIRHARCRPFLKEIPKAGATAQVLEVTIGTKGGVDTRERIIIKSLPNEEKWKSAARGYAVMEAVSAHGFGDGLFRVPRPVDSDSAAHLLIEEGLRGKSLHDKLVSATPVDGREYLRLSARWLARLHNSRLVITDPDEFLPKEAMRFERYLQHFTATRNPRSRKFREIMEAVQEEEKRVASHERAGFVQGHGDYHPKNIFICHDSADDTRGTSYVAAIDFGSSLVLPPAFDVGCFLAQFRNQFFVQPEVLRNYPEGIFVEAYLREAGNAGAGFLRQVELFKARANLQIASYLVNVGLGESEDLWRVLVEAEQAINIYNAG